MTGRKERAMKKDWVDIDQLQLLYNFAEIVADDVKEEGYSYDKAQGALEGAILMFFILTDAPTEFLSGIGKEVYERFLEKLVGVNDDI